MAYENELDEELSLNLRESVRKLSRHLKDNWDDHEALVLWSLPEKIAEFAGVHAWTWRLSH